MWAGKSQMPDATVLAIELPTPHCRQPPVFPERPKMLETFTPLWPWLLAALGVGAATGGLAGPGLRRSPARWLVLFLGATFAAGAAVFIGAIDGALAHVAALGALCFVAFLAGAVSVAAARGALGGHERWALGLIPVAAIWWGGAHFAPSVEAPPAANPPPAQIAAPEPAPPQARNPDQTNVIPTPAAPSTDPAAVLAALPAGALDAAACQRALDAVAVAEPVVFNPTHATIHRRAALALDKAVEVIRRCPEATIEVRGYDDGDGANEALALRRARAAERYLRDEGVGGRKLAVSSARAPRSGEGVIGYALR
jgi:OmpA-OmpF porin, OOP family